jgi:hypothetical protein
VGYRAVSELAVSRSSAAVLVSGWVMMVMSGPRRAMVMRLNAAIDSRLQAMTVMPVASGRASTAVLA